MARSCFSQVFQFKISNNFLSFWAFFLRLWLKKGKKESGEKASYWLESWKSRGTYINDYSKSGLTLDVTQGLRLWTNVHRRCFSRWKLVHFPSAHPYARAHARTQPQPHAQVFCTWRSSRFQRTRSLEQKVICLPKMESISTWSSSIRTLGGLLFHSTFLHRFNKNVQFYTGLWNVIITVVTQVAGVWICQCIVQVWARGVLVLMLMLSLMLKLQWRSEA